MKKGLNGFAGNLLVALNVFIVFLLVFENKIIIPYWLQPIGRMHPMIIHFSIVILILAMFLEFFRFKSELNTEDLYHRFASNLLVVGTIFAAITVIMGLFLSHEDGYSGSTLQWHKWSGISIVLVSSVIYWSRNAEWYKPRVARAGAVLTFFFLLLAGHYGATLSHGEDFLIEPVLSQFKRNVPIEDALVFDDVIKPIFQEKCVSCHSSSKLKGNLILTNAADVLKGGKNGKLFIPGKPELSLLLQRIHLPENDKKHMPPKNEAQLDDEETAILLYWIKGNADMNKKVIDLPYSDSLRVLAAKRLKPAEPEEEYDFAAADNKTIQKLSNSYRVITPLAKESPALSVNIYNRASYNPKLLDELGDIKKQIVSLELNKMPVKDADLKYVSRFENLRTLDLNFTDITGKGLEELTSLKHLKNLSISGTQVTYKDLEEQINDFTSLKTLTVWNTQVKEGDIKKLKKLNNHVSLVFGFKDDGANPIQLPPPLLRNRSHIFSTTVPVQIRHNVNGVEIRYTLDGTEPDSLKSPILKGDILIKENTNIRAKAFKKGWFSSNPVEFHFYKSQYKPDSVILVSSPDPDRLAEGVNTFFDNFVGTTELPRSTSEKWIGYAKNNMEVILEFKKETLISSVGLNTLIKPESGVFPPTSVQIWGGTPKAGMRLLSTINPPKAERETKPFITTLVGKFSPQKVSFIKVVAVPLKDMPKPNPNSALLTPKERETLIARLKAAKEKEIADRKNAKPGDKKKGPDGPRPGMILVDEIFIN
jgi:uncharacterized membrane protein